MQLSLRASITLRAIGGHKATTNAMLEGSQNSACDRGVGACAARVRMWRSCREWGRKRVCPLDASTLFTSLQFIIWANTILYLERN